MKNLTYNSRGAKLLQQATAKALTEPGAKWTPETGWTDKPVIKTFHRLKAGQRKHLIIPKLDMMIHGVLSIEQDKYGTIYVDLDATGAFTRGFKGSDHDIEDTTKYPDVGAIVDHVFPNR